MTKKLKYSTPYLAKDYFAKDILPSTLYAGRKTLRQSMPYQQQEEITILLTTEGRGTITINETAYPMEPGCLVCISPGQFFKAEPDRSSPPELWECHVNAGVYFYLTACPYYARQAACLPAPPTYARLNRAQNAHIAGVMSELAIHSTKAPISENQPAFFLLMKLFGLLEHYAEQP